MSSLRYTSSNFICAFIQGKLYYIMNLGVERKQKSYCPCEARTHDLVMGVYVAIAGVTVTRSSQLSQGALNTSSS